MARLRRSRPVSGSAYSTRRRAIAADACAALSRLLAGTTRARRRRGTYWPASISAGSTGDLPMSAPEDRPHLSAVAAGLGCLLLTVCTGQTNTTVNWVKSGADDATVSRELQDC